MNKTALLVVDVQTALMDSQPYEADVLIANIQKLLEECRSKGVEVIYVRHNGASGEFKMNTPGWQIYKAITPATGEKIFDKHFNSAFRHTGLQDYLKEKEISSLILAGMQTEYCIDVTCKVAFEFGYNVIIGEGTITTLEENSLSAKQINEHYHYEIWNNRYAKVLPVDQVIKDYIG